MVGINIGFYTHQLGIRGTEVTIYNYAKYNQDILRNKSYIFYDKDHEWTDKDIVKRFKDEFENVIDLDNFNDIDTYIKQFDIKVLFNEKGGGYDGNLSKIAKNITHCVFNCGEPHGDIYCAISKYVNNYNNNPILPYMIDLPEHQEDFRKELNIPDDAVVFGRHGGFDQFDINYVKEAVYEHAINNPNVYFIFVHTRMFCPVLKNIIHIEKIIDLDIKRKFINTCDAMIWARNQGETFGLSIAEFSISNKPVIATPVGDQAHVHFLGNKGFWYNNKIELLNIFNNFDRVSVKTKDWNCFRDYCPEKVIKIFEDIINSLL